MSADVASKKKKSFMVVGSKEHYLKEVVPVLQKELGVKSVMRVPSLQKIVLNMGLGESKNNRAVLTEGVRALTLLAGQKPVTTKAKRSIDGFKIREGMAIGVKVTLRSARMYDFFQRLVHIVLPRVRDFHGLKRKGFDGRGGFTLGFKDASVFPELSSANDIFNGGLSVSFVTTGRESKEVMRLLELMGVPFIK